MPRFASSLFSSVRSAFERTFRSARSGASNRLDARSSTSHMTLTPASSALTEKEVDTVKFPSPTTGEVRAGCPSSSTTTLSRSFSEEHKASITNANSAATTADPSARWSFTDHTLKDLFTDVEQRGCLLKLRDFSRQEYVPHLVGITREEDTREEEQRSRWTMRLDIDYLPIGSDPSEMYEPGIPTKYLDEPLPGVDSFTFNKALHFGLTMTEPVRLELGGGSHLDLRPGYPRPLAGVGGGRMTDSETKVTTILSNAPVNISTEDSQIGKSRVPETPRTVQATMFINFGSPFSELLARARC